MVFFDETGRRWKRIKRSTLGIALLSSIPVAALIGGSMVYQPHWSNLNLLKPDAGVAPVIHGSTLGAATVQPQSTPTQTPTPKRPAAKLSAVIFGLHPTTTSSAPRVPTQPSPTPMPRVTPAPIPAASASPAPSGNNTHNDFGQSHNPKH